MVFSLSQIGLCHYKRSEDITLLVDQYWFYCYPCPHIAIFANGSEFSYEFFGLLLSYDITAKPTMMKNPQTKAIVEQTHQIMGDLIRIMELHKQKYDCITINAII